MCRGRGAYRVVRVSSPVRAYRRPAIRNRLAGVEHSDDVGTTSASVLIMAPEIPHHSSRQPNRQRIPGILLNLLGWGGGLFFLILVWKQAAAVEWSGITIDWATLATSFVLLLIGLALQSQLAWITQPYLRYPVEHAPI